MLYYRCQCGLHEAWGSMPPYPCSGCEQCGTTLETGPGMHRKPKEHNWTPTAVATDTGDQTLTRCSWCGIRKIDFDKEQAAKAAQQTHGPET